jgi:hypothetical protein
MMFPQLLSGRSVFCVKRFVQSSLDDLFDRNMGNISQFHWFESVEGSTGFPAKPTDYGSLHQI